jgi:hypothetical protein
MTDRPQEPEDTTTDADSGGPGAQRIMVIAIAALAGVIVLGFLIALALAFFAPGAADGIQIVRDFFIIILALEGILIGAALIVLVLQIARLTNLLQNEVRPILEETNDTVKTVKGTATFVSRNVADPVIRASGFFTWLLAFLREILGVRRALRGTASSRNTPDEGVAE